MMTRAGSASFFSSVQPASGNQWGVDVSKYGDNSGEDSVMVENHGSL
jgi:hypothetical protein